MPELQADGTYIERHEELPSEEIKRRLAEKASLLKELEGRRPKPEPGAPQPAPTPVAAETEPPLQLSLPGRITADGRKLAGLMSRAKKLEAKAEADSERANASRQAAYTARLDLTNYMTSNGLA